MRSRDVVGRVIVEVKQRQFWNDLRKEMGMVLEGFVLSDGSEVVLMVDESGSEPYVTAGVKQIVSLSDYCRGVGGE